MKATSIHVSLAFASAILAQSGSRSAHAGHLEGKADSHSKVEVTAYDKDGNVVTPPRHPDDKTQTIDAGSNGKFEVYFGDDQTEKKINYYLVTRNVGGAPMTSSVKQGASLSLGSNEPLDVPVFAAIQPLVTTIDLPALLKAGDPLTAGETVTVTDGTIVGMTAIIFRDGSSLPTSGTFTEAEIDALPYYTGSASVFSFDHVQAVPEPSSLVLATIAVMGGLSVTLLRRRQGTSRCQPADR
jgi:hypothetical protein